MVNSFGDGFTEKLVAKMSEYEDRIYAVEDGISSLEENETAIIDYLKDIRCSMPLGLALRRYLCGKFSKGYSDGANGYVFVLSDNQTVVVSDYNRDDYDIVEDDVKEYTEIFMDINARFNTNQNGELVSEINKAEARRMLRVTTACLRNKMFSISFALHMDSVDMYKFLTDVLAEQSYNYRSPDEVIAYYCHTHEEANTYIAYTRIKEEYMRRAALSPASDVRQDNYTRFARRIITMQVETEEQLYDFLLANRANFAGYSQTAYNEFMQLFLEALSRTKIQTLSNDEYLQDSFANTEEQRKEREERINKAIGLQSVTNTEQLARRMLQCIPRATMEKVKDNGKKVITSDFIPIYNGEKGQKSKKVQTTTLPKEITMNLLMKDRLDDLIREIKPVDRKDLVFLKFYLLSLDLQEKEGDYSSTDYRVFMDECNAMLLRCGMSKLYPANRFENLILLSLVSSNPFEMFEDIIEYSFINEPMPVQEDSYE